MCFCVIVSKCGPADTYSSGKLRNYASLRLGEVPSHQLMCGFQVLFMKMNRVKISNNG